MHALKLFFTGLMAALFTGAALAQDVTLTSTDGSVEISGTLLGFDGENYRVDSKFGELTVDSSGVRCDGPGCPNLADFVADLRFSGATGMADVLLPALVEGFARRNGYRVRRDDGHAQGFSLTLSKAEDDKPLGRFHFHVTNTDEGFADLLARDTDVVMALRQIRDSELRHAGESGMTGLKDARRNRVLALDAIVPVVAQDNPVWQISPENLSRVLAGLITNWSELGGPDAPIALHLPGSKGGFAQAIEDQLLNAVNLTGTEDFTSHDSNIGLTNAVAADSFALGMASYADTGNARPMTLTGTCGFSLRATRRNVKTEDYPLNAPLFLYLAPWRLPKIGREFLAYTNSAAAQIVIRRAGYVDQAVEEFDIDQQGNRFANAILAAGPETKLETVQDMAQVMAGAKRLTLSFRFEAGSTLLDAQSRSNVHLLAGALEGGMYDGRELVFIGFSDGQGPALGNTRIAKKRADTVRNAVFSAAETLRKEAVRDTVTAFGEAMPMACDDSEWGRRTNRRVEVWVR